MAQGRQRQPFEMPFTFSLKNILSIVADHLSEKSTFDDLPEKATEQREEMYVVNGYSRRKLLARSPFRLPRATTRFSAS
jgi:hypothetical protein